IGEIQQLIEQVKSMDVDKSGLEEIQLLLEQVKDITIVENTHVGYNLIPAF
ncbi:4910_t:CDS:1, partial [Gigaspora rosea]